MSQIDLKPGDSCDVVVGEKTLVVEPIPFGRLKKLARMIFGSIEELGSWKSDEVMKRVPDLLDEKLEDFCKLAFDPAKHPFLTKEWIDDNITFVLFQDILDRIIKVNGLRDFLGAKGVKASAPSLPPMTETRPLQEMK